MIAHNCLCKAAGGGSHVGEYVGIAVGVALVAFLVFRVTRRRRAGSSGTARPPLHQSSIAAPGSEIDAHYSEL